MPKCFSVWLVFTVFLSLEISCPLSVSGGNFVVIFIHWHKLFTYCFDFYLIYVLWVFSPHSVVFTLGRLDFIIKCFIVLYCSIFHLFFVNFFGLP